MNPRFLFHHTLAGVFAGYGAWLTFRATDPWTFGEGFLPTLFTSGVFAALLLGLAAALPPLFDDWQARKAGHQFLAAAVPALAFAMPATVVFAIVAGSTGLARVLPLLVLRAFWWSLLAAALGACRGFVTGSLRAAATTGAGLLPGLVGPGLLFDLFFLPRGLWLPGSLFLGAVAGACLALALDLLKEAWLEDLGGSAPWRTQFLLETEEFVAGGDEDCDLVLPEAPPQAFSILEKDEGHVLESLDDTPIKVTGCRFRCRLLVDGDVIEAGGRTLVYHNRLARSRDAVPQPAG